MEQISVSGTALNFAAIDQPAVVTVHNVHNERELFVKVESSAGNPIPVTLKQEADSVRIEFTPRSPGEHAIHLSYKRMLLPGSPFATKVYNIKEISVKEMPKEIVVGKPVTFLG